jgi:hypothetical protein
MNLLGNSFTEVFSYDGTFTGLLDADKNVDCCCFPPSGCCIPLLSDTLCLTIDSYAGTGLCVPGTRKIELTQILSILGGTKRVWEGSGEYSPAGNTIRVRLAAICDPSSDNVDWYLCHDACTTPGDMNATELCEVRADDNPFLAGNQWIEIATTTNATCLDWEYITTPLSSCDNECSTTWTVAEGACP